MITKFKGEYGFLSNFYACPVWLDGAEYPTVENAFQAAKVLRSNDSATEAAWHRKTLQVCTPSEAKKLGARAKLRPDWKEIRDSVMFGLLYQKFVQHQTFRDKLLLTNELFIIEGNDWHDRYWGCELDFKDKDSQYKTWLGKNKLGRMVMSLRSFLLEEDTMDLTMEYDYSND